MHTMMPEVLRKKSLGRYAKREAGNQPLLPGAGKSAFVPFDRGPGVGEGSSQQRASTDVQGKLDSLLRQITPEAVPVFSAALNAGLRPGVVLAAVERAFEMLQQR